MFEIVLISPLDGKLKITFSVRRLANITMKENLYFKPDRHSDDHRISHLSHITKLHIRINAAASHSTLSRATPIQATTSKPGI